jgi:hypothetical protein
LFLVLFPAARPLNWALLASCTRALVRERGDLRLAMAQK